MAISQAGQEAVAFMLGQIEKNIVTLPVDFSLEYIALNTNVSVQNIGSAFDHYIKRPLATQGIKAVKYKTRKVHIKLTKI